MLQWMLGVLSRNSVVKVGTSVALYSIYSPRFCLWLALVVIIVTYSLSQYKLSFRSEFLPMYVNCREQIIVCQKHKQWSDNEIRVT